MREGVCVWMCVREGGKEGGLVRDRERGGGGYEGGNTRLIQVLL